MNQIYSGYDIKLNKEENRAYKGKMLKIEGNSYQETRDEVAGTTVSGDFISISDAQDLPITKFNIEGKSIQETREGYNHFNAGNLNLTNTTQMSQNWQNDVLTVTSAGLPFALASQNITDLVKNNPGKTLTFDFEEITFTQVDVTKSSPIQMNIYFSDGTATKYWSIVDYQKIKHPYTIPTDTSNISSVLICVYSWNGTGNDSEFTTTVKKPMLYLGAEEKEYERYGKTPSIEFKAPVESVGDNIQLFDISTVTTNKFVYADSGELGASTVSITSDYIPVAANETYTALLDYETLAQDGPRGIALYDNDKKYISGVTYTSSKKGFTYTPTQSGYLRFSYDNNCTVVKFSKGTSTGAYSPYGQGSVEICKCNKNFFNKDNIREKHRLDDKGLDYYQVDYFVSDYIPVKEKTKYVKNTLISTMQAVSYYDKDKNHIKRNTTENPFTTPEGTCYIRTGDLLTNLDTLQVEEGSLSTEYAPHQSQIKALYTQQPFRAIGDVKDRFVKKAGVWYEEHNYNTKMITGDEAWIYVESTKTWYVEAFFKDKLSASEIKSTHYPCMLASQTADVQDGYMAGNKGASAVNRIYLKDLQNAPVTFAEFKPWIKNLNIVIYYQLNTPLLIPCTPEQVEVLESMRTYEGVNHIYTTDELKPTISLRYNYMPALPSLDGESKVKSVGDNINLLNFSNYIKNNLPNIEVTQNNDMSIVLNGTTDAYGGDIRCVYEKPITLKAGSYTFGYGVNGVNMFNNELNISSLGNGTYLVVKKMAGSFTETTITFDEDFELYNYNIHLEPNTTFEDFVIYPKICKGTSTGAYSPYGQGSVEIKQVNGNLVDFNLSQNSKVTVNNDGTVTINGNGGFGLNFKQITFKTNKTYYMNWVLETGKVTQPNNDIIMIPGGRKWAKQGEYTSFSFNEDTAKNSLWINADATFENAKMKIWISEEKIEYIPHQIKTQIMYTQQPFRSIGDIRDRFVKIDGIWYEEHNIGRYIFTGNEGWKKSSRTDVNRYYVSNIINTILNASTVDILCSHFKALTPSQSDTAMIGISKYNEKGLMVNVDLTNTELDTVDKFKAKLTELYNAGTPLYVDYVLAEPELIPCTPQQSTILDQLENIQLYDGVNYIYTIDEIQPLLTLEIYNMIEDYDLYVSNDGYFGIPGTDIKFLVNFHESNLPTMPEAVEASVRAAGRDGDYVLNTTYEPLPFEIVCYTEDNLTVTQKREIESKVNRFLNSIKNRTKKIAFEKGEKFYNVKYNGLLTTTNYPAHLKFSIPLKSSESFGKDAYQKVLSGNSTEVSDTVEEVGALITIYGPATLPIIALNDYSMEYDTAILEGARVEIDTAKSTATHINSDGVKTNVMRHYNHQFPKIQPGENTLKVLSGVDDENNVTVKWNDLKL